MCDAWSLVLDFQQQACKENTRRRYTWRDCLRRKGLNRDGVEHSIGRDLRGEDEILHEFASPHRNIFSDSV